MSSASSALQDRRKLLDNEDSGDCGELCAALVQHLCRRVPTAAAWRLLEDLCHFAKSHASGPLVTKALPLAGGHLEVLEAPDDSAISCCRCVETMVTCLGRELLQNLKAIVRPLLKLAQAPLGVELERSELVTLNTYSLYMYLFCSTHKIL